MVRILEGEGVKMLKPRSEAEAELRKDLAEKGLNAFSLVLVAPSVYVGVHSLVQASGIGPIMVFIHICETIPIRIFVCVGRVQRIDDPDRYVRVFHFEVLLSGITIIDLFPDVNINY